MDAAALTAYSNEELGPVPAWAARRESRIMTARSCQRCSSRLTISSPYLAVERQCTLRSSSPSLYARGMTSSSPAAAVILVLPSPSFDQLPFVDALASGTTL